MRKKKMSFFGSVLSIVDVYDAITSQRVYRTSVTSPDRALGIMLEGMGKKSPFFRGFTGFPVFSILLDRATVKNKETLSFTISQQKRGM
jgi:hypothetical protein